MNNDTVIVAQTDMISSEVEYFKKKIFAEFTSSPQRVILDLQKVRVIDSSGIGCLLQQIILQPRLIVRWC